MAADITLLKYQNDYRKHPEFLITFEDDDADYWYLYTTMIKEIKLHTGELIDLYSDCEFYGDNLKILKNIVSKTITDLYKQKIDTWEVHTGTELGTIKKEIYKTLKRKDLINKLNKFMKIIETAESTDDKVVSIGD